MSPQRSDRRRFLQTLGVFGVGGAAGCLGDGTDTTTPTTAAPTESPAAGGPTGTTPPENTKTPSSSGDDELPAIHTIGDREPADFADPLIGHTDSRWMLYPGPSRPFSMVKLSPDNQLADPIDGGGLWKGGYEYTIDRIDGFSHLHSWTMGGLLTMPTTGETGIMPIDSSTGGGPGYASAIRHETEEASPGYYAVHLDDHDVRAELTSTTRGGFQRYTFPESDDASIVFDLLTSYEYEKDLLEASVERVSDTEIEGSVHLEGPAWQGTRQEYTLYFVARTDTPFESMDGWNGEEIQQDVTGISGSGDTGVMLNFETEAEETIRLQTAISFVDLQGARANLQAELEPFDWDFDACHQDGRREWNELLSRIRVEVPDPEPRETDLTKFYTNFYRSYSARTIMSDVDGRYVDMNEEVNQLDDPDSPIYGCDALWNTFWNLNQLWTLATPAKMGEWVRSLLEIYEVGGWLPTGPAGIEYTRVMVASHAIPFIVGAYQHGIDDFDTEKAFEAMHHQQTTPGVTDLPGGGAAGNMDLEPYLQQEYVPVGMGYTSNTLEYAYDDWCVAQFAKATGRTDQYRTFSERSHYWKNIFDTDRGFMRPKDADGNWKENFDPSDESLLSGDWVEGNAWQYTWFVPQDVPGLVEEMSRLDFFNRLDRGFEQSAEAGFNGFDLPINHGNQPSMQAAYLFNYAGVPWFTQRWARAIMDEYYGVEPTNGWPGDEDQGQGGAWFTMSAMGLFQTDGGARTDPIYEIGSPLFEEVTIVLDDEYYDGDTFVIEANNNPGDNQYVQSATLNGESLDQPWFRADTLQQGGRLVLEMGPEPNKQWGRGLEKAPPSGNADAPSEQ